jgi:hypothetical protein
LKLGFESVLLPHNTNNLDTVIALEQKGNVEAAGDPLAERSPAIFPRSRLRRTNQLRYLIKTSSHRRIKSVEPALQHHSRPPLAGNDHKIDHKTDDERKKKNDTSHTIISAEYMLPEKTATILQHATGKVSESPNPAPPIP